MSIFWLDLGDRVYKLSGLGELCDTKVRRKIPRVSLERIKNGNLNLIDIEKRTILAALDRTDYVQQDAAKVLGISPRVLNYKINQHKITHKKWTVNV